MTDRTAYEICESDEQQRSDRPAYPYQPVRGTLGIDLGDLNEYDFTPLDAQRRATACASTISKARKAPDVGAKQHGA